MSASPTETNGPSRLTTPQKRLAGFIVVLGVVSVAYRLVYATGYSRSAALYIGVPTVLAIGLALLPHSKSATGMLVKGATISVLVAAIFLPEGLLCLLFALPLVLVVAVIVGAVLDVARMRDRRTGPTLAVVAIPLLIFSTEGVIGSPFDAHDSAQSSSVVAASERDVVAALAATPTFDAPMPTFLKIGFNRPIAGAGVGINVGDERDITFTGGNHDDHPLRLFGITGHRSVHDHSHMHLTVAESVPGRVVFAIDHDSTMLARWADLQRAIVTWTPIDDRHLRVTWRLEYERLIYPTFYFAPLQRFGMDQAADYLLDAIIVSRLR